jgi:hypothetical protein
MYTATYRRLLQDWREIRVVKIELQYELTPPERVYVELVRNCFQKALERGYGLVVLSKTDLKQKVFTDCVANRYGFDTYSEDELDLYAIMKSVWKKSLEQVNYEIDLFPQEGVSKYERQMQEYALAKRSKQNLVGCEVLTRRQFQHLATVMGTFTLKKACTQNDNGLNR